MLQFLLCAVLSILWIDFIARRIKGVFGLIAYALTTLFLTFLIAYHPFFLAIFARG